MKVTSIIIKRRLVCMACLFPTAAIALNGAQVAVSSQCGEPCLTLHVSKDADHGLSFSVAYTTIAKTEDCVTHNRMAGVTTQQTRYEFLSPVRKGQTYRIEIPLGKFVGGKCGWKVAGIFLDVVSVAYKRASGAEQAAYLCQTEELRSIPALGSCFVLPVGLCLPSAVTSLSS